jgi:hypothetical protein
MYPVSEGTYPDRLAKTVPRHSIGYLGKRTKFAMLGEPGA